MINPNELRIGNIVWESSSFTPGPADFEEIFVGAINDIDKVVYDNQNNIYSYDYLYPIPLTVEWMMRLGFEWNATDKRYYFIAPESWAGSCPWNIVKHVHQVQNLYFALTGEELKIKS
jgi:hypothetical protein